jgi:hypothetical protein
MRGKFNPQIPSNANLFAKRGNPWVTRREGIRDFGREPSVLSGTENPDMDMYTRAGRAPQHFERGPDKPVREATADDHLRATNIIRKMRNEQRGDLLVVVKSPHPRDANTDARGIPYESRPGEKRSRPEAFKPKKDSLSDLNRVRKPLLTLPRKAKGEKDD